LYKCPSFWNVPLFATHKSFIHAFQVAKKFWSVFWLAVVVVKDTAGTTVIQWYRGFFPPGTLFPPEKSITWIVFGAGDLMASCVVPIGPKTACEVYCVFWIQECLWKINLIKRSCTIFVGENEQTLGVAIGIVRAWSSYWALQFWDITLCLQCQIHVSLTFFSTDFLLIRKPFPWQRKSKFDTF